MISTTTGQQHPYTLIRERDLPADHQRRFKIKTLNARARMRIYDELVGVDESGEPVPRTGSGYLCACRYGVEWEPWTDADGNEVRCVVRKHGSQRVLMDQSLDAIADHILELGMAVMKHNNLSENEPEQTDETEQDGGDGEPEDERKN